MNCLDQQSIAELKSFSKPPSKIISVLQGVMILLQKKEDWQSIKKELADPNFSKKLMAYDKDNIPDSTQEKLESHIQKNNLEDIDAIKSCSVPAANLATYVVSMNKYCQIVEKVKPKFDKKRDAKELLAQKIVEIQNIEKAQQDLISRELYQKESEIKHAGLQTNFDGKKHIIHYVIEDNDGKLNVVNGEVDPEDENLRDSIRRRGAYELGNYLNADGNYGSNPNIDQESLLFISNEIKKKDQSKKFVLWETNELRNQWDDKMLPPTKAQAVQKTNSHQWTHEPNKYSVSVIDSKKTKGKAQKTPFIYEPGDSLASVPKKDHYLNNVFLQSHLQDRLEEQNQKQKAPWSHNTLNKNEKPKKYMVEGRPLFEGKGSHVQNINSGRSRIFYTSNVF